MCECVLETVLRVFVALSNFTYLIFNAELFSTLKVGWGEGPCASSKPVFSSLLLFGVCC